MDHKGPLSEVVLGMVRAAKGHKGPEWEEIAAVGCAVQVKKTYATTKGNFFD